MNLDRFTTWRARLAIEALTLIVFAVVMEISGAPPWALVLAVLVATRQSRFESAATLRTLHRDIEKRLPAPEKRPSGPEKPKRTTGDDWGGA